MAKRAQKTKKETSSSWRKLVDTIALGDAVEAVEAAKKLIELRTRPALKPLIGLFRKGEKPQIREFAGYALACMNFPQLNCVFIECLQNSKESENVRGQAAEALGMLHAKPLTKRKNDDYRNAESALLDSLLDSSPAVRFWCCFALGCMESRRAIKPLLRLKTTDKTLYPGWWFIREEASDALNKIQGRISSDRIPFHMRPKSRK